MIPQYKRTLARCDELIKRAATPELDGLIVSAMCQHICVLLAGTLETAVREVLSQYCLAKGAPTVASYASRRINTFKNADPEKICELLRQFDSQWESDLNTFWKGEIRDHVGSIVGNRHQIAHGRPTEVSLARVKEWRLSLDKFIMKLIDVTGR